MAHIAKLLVHHLQAFPDPLYEGNLLKSGDYSAIPWAGREAVQSQRQEALYPDR